MFLIVVAVSLTAVSANPEISSPDGFEINDNLTVVDQEAIFMGMDAVETIVVMENGTDNITITTFKAEQDIDITPSGGSQAKTIKDKDGIYQVNDGRYIFLYKDKDQFVQIDSPTEKLIEEVLD